MKQMLSSPKQITTAVDYLYKTLNSSKKPTLWLLSGGSSIGYEVAVAKKLSLSTKSHIHVALVDERFVPIGSKDSNWFQLEESGFEFNSFASATPILKPELKAFECAKQYDEELDELFSMCKGSIGVYGIGADGHTAGIKPTNDPESFIEFSGPSLVLSYQGDDFSRITTTAKVVRHLSQVVVLAAGRQKQPLLSALSKQTQPHKMPAQLLKEAENVVIFN